MNERSFVWTRDDRLTAVIGLVLLALLYLARLHSYLLFHTLAEIVFIVVCLSVLVVAWSLRQFLDDDFAVFLGAGAGRGRRPPHRAPRRLPRPQPDQPLARPADAGLARRPPTARRLFHHGDVLHRPAHARGSRPPLPRRLRGCSCSPASTGGTSSRRPCASARGLTPFKKISEYVICLLFVLAIALLWRKRDKLPYQSWRLLRAALVATIISELWFTLYHSTATWPNLIGHLFLVISALLIFRAVVDDGLARPHALAIQNLREAETHAPASRAGPGAEPAGRARGLRGAQPLPLGRAPPRPQRRLHRRARPRRGRHRRHLRRRQRARPQRRRAGRHAARQLAGARGGRRRPRRRSSRACAPCSSASARTRSPTPRSASPGSTRAAKR